MRGTNEAQEPPIFDGPIGQRLVQPGVEPAARGLKHPAHGSDATLVTMFVHELVLYPGSLAKYAAAFFRISRSSLGALQLSA